MYPLDGGVAVKSRTPNQVWIVVDLLSNSVSLQAFVLIFGQVLFEELFSNVVLVAAHASKVACSPSELATYVHLKARETVGRACRVGVADI